jgi:hypothetical protein
MLVRTMQLSGWNHPITNEQPYRQAEQELLDYVMLDPYDNWSTILSDHQLTRCIAGIKKVFVSYDPLGYVAPDCQPLTDLIKQLTERLPPIIAMLSSDGTPQLSAIDLTHTLYAGWVYFIGNRHLTVEPLSFLQTNMLCDRALLQQRAIDIAREKRMK